MPEPTDFGHVPGFGLRGGGGMLAAVGEYSVHPGNKPIYIS